MSLTNVLVNLFLYPSVHLALALILLDLCSALKTNYAGLTVQRSQHSQITAFASVIEQIMCTLFITYKG